MKGKKKTRALAKFKTRVKGQSYIVKVYKRNKYPGYVANLVRTEKKKK